MTLKPDLTLMDFEGRWTLNRVITDHKTGSVDQFEGIATFTRADFGLSYVETGQLHLTGHPPIKAERRYRWCSDGCAIALEFEDGRPFHMFSGASPKATHWCDPDTYDVVYDFEGWPDWTSTWKVSGPRKAYKMISSYARDIG